MFDRNVLAVDPAKEVELISATLREQVLGQLRRRGAVVGLSGGIDSSVVAALCVRALGKERVLGLFMPEHHSSDDALTLGRMLASHLGIETILEDIAPALEGLGCYRRQIEAIRTVFPAYDDSWQCKLALPSILEGERLNITKLTVQDPSGAMTTERLTPSAYLQLVAATNYKQRARKMTEYYHADRLNYAVAGTPNRLEYDQGFFVKGGDGLADLKPIAHLFKTQVYQIGAHLGVPERVMSRPPTTDTWSLPQSQEEFYFGLPTRELDRFLDAYIRGESPEAAGARMGYAPEQVKRVYHDIRSKREATRYQHLPPLLVAPVELDGSPPLDD